MRIQQLPENVRITGISSLLSKSQNYTEWLVGVFYRDKDNFWTKEKPLIKNLKFSNIPMLAKGRIYNADEATTYHYSKANFIIPNFDKFSNSDKAYFEYNLDICYQNKTFEKVQVKLPKLELARILFFQNSYLATSALQERVLDLDFATEQDYGKNVITVLPHCTLGKTLFEDIGFRNKLSWLLLNTNIKNSYNSIYQNLAENKMNDENDKNYEIWNFNFTLPPLHNLNFEIRGNLKDNILYVDEILSIRGINSGIIGEVIFEGDRFTQAVTTPSGAESSTQSNNKKEPSINDEAQANSDLSLQIIDTPQVVFEFANPIVSSIKRSRVVNNPGVQMSSNNEENEESNLDDSTVATDEATTTGNAPKGEFQNTADTTNRDTQYRQNFEALINSLEKIDLDGLALESHELPKVPRCKLYKKSDGNPRVLLVAKFQYKNQPFMAFEIDITDLENKRISTLIVRDNHENRDFDDLLEEIVRTSLKWSKIPFTQKVNLHHPKDFYDGVSNTQDMIDGWANRIEQALEQLL